MAPINKILSKNWYVFLIFAAAFFLRAFKLYDFATFLGDQGRDAIVMKRIITFEHFPAIGPSSSIGQIYLGPFYYYLIAPFLLLFKFNPIGPAWGVVFLSMIGIILSYFFLQKEFSKDVAFMFTILLSFSAVNIKLSRFSWNPNLLPIFSFFTIYFFYKFLISRNKLYSFLLGAFLSFSIQLHYLATFLIFTISVVYLLIVLGRLWKLSRNYFSPKLIKRVKDEISRMMIIIISFSFFSLPLLIFDLRHNFLNARNFIKLFKRQGLISNQSYLNRILETNNSFVNYIFQINLRPIAALSITTFILISLFLILRRRKVNLFFKINLFNYLFFIVLFSLLNSPRYPHYYGVIYISFFLLLAWLFGFLWQKNILLRLAVFFLIGFYLFNNIKNYDFLFNKPISQIKKARKIALSILPKIKKRPYQMVALPVGETDGHIRYFLEINGQTPLAEDSVEEPQELFVLCFRPECSILGNSQWQIASFKRPKVDKIWKSEGLKIYKLIHEKQNLNFSSHSLLQ